MNFVSAINEHQDQYVGSEVLTAVVMKRTIIWDTTPCIPLKVNRRFGWFLPQLIFSSLKMEAICSSETSDDTRRTTRRYIPEDGTLEDQYGSQNHISIYLLFI
jgi:hypothetical protein